MNTTPVEVAANRSPPSAGPANVPTLSIVLPTAFAAVSSTGVLARDGVSAACAGWKAVETIATSTASAYIAMAGAWASAATPAPASATARIRSVQIITRARLCRSPRTDEKGATTADESMRASMSNPTAVAPPAW